MEKFPKEPVKEKVKPKNIEEAIKRGDIAFLRAAGRKGGQKAALKREINKLIKKQKEEQLLQEMQGTIDERVDYDHDDNPLSDKRVDFLPQ